MINSDPNKISDQIKELIYPIIKNTTAVWNRMQFEKRTGCRAQIPDSEEEQLALRECVHIIEETDRNRQYIEANGYGGYNVSFGNIKLVSILTDSPAKRDGFLYCPVCKRHVPMAFSKENEKILTNSVEVLNQLCFFSILFNQAPENIKTYIAMKKLMPDVTYQLANINTIAALENSASDTYGNIASQYSTGNGITDLY